jgi:peroxiredoxin
MPQASAGRDRTSWAGPAHLVIDQGQHVAGCVQQDVTRRGQPQAFSAALKQRRSADPES